MTENTRVTILIRAGLIAEPGLARFEDVVADPGTVGELLPADETDRHLPPGWRLVRVEVDGRTLYAPLHPSQYAVAA